MDDRMRTSRDTGKTNSGRQRMSGVDPRRTDGRRIDTRRPDTRRTDPRGTAPRGTDVRRTGTRRPEEDRVRMASGRSGVDRPNPNRPNPAKSNPNARRKRPVSRRKRKQFLIIRSLIIAVLVIGAVGSLLLWKKYGPSKEKADLNKYYGITNENQLAVIVDNEVVGAGGMLIDGKPYIEYSVVRDKLNGRLYWDANENLLLYTLPKDMVSVGVGSKDYTISKTKYSEDYVILKTEGSTAYIALDFVQKYTNLDYKIYSKPAPDRVMIVTEWGKTKVASVKGGTQVRYRGGVKSPVLTEVEKDDQVTVIEKEDNWTKVRTKDGFIGYIKAGRLRDEKEVKTSRKFEEEQFTSISKDYTINLAWHQVTTKSANSNILETIAGTKGLTTISPTWFSVKNNKGDISSIASTDYVNYAHQSNIEVWGLIDNFNKEVDSFELLSHTSRRDNLINQLIAEALKTGIDGINVDFENISEETGEHYIQFIRELSVKCRQNGLVLSVDNYVPKGFNAHYYREEQGVVTDYVVIMGYDEHYNGSYESGSVASYNFVKDGIKQTLKDVPAKKVINAVPFYTRIWKEVPKTETELAEEAGTEDANYKTKVTSEALSMKEAQNRIKAAGAKVKWDDKAKQNYAQWDADGATYKIWVEDAKSIEAKLQLMKDYQLAGSAAWKLGFETSNIWELILKYVN